MKTEKEIRKRMVEAIDFILNCKEGCASKSPGDYCRYCWRINTDFETLAWVLNKEDNIEALRVEVKKVITG